jgi:hypothetical protein
MDDVIWYSLTPLLWIRYNELFRPKGIFIFKRNQLVIAPVFGTFIGNLKSLAQDIENFILSKESILSKETVPFIGIVNPPRHPTPPCTYRPPTLSFIVEFEDCKS